MIDSTYRLEAFAFQGVTKKSADRFRENLHLASGKILIISDQYFRDLLCSNCCNDKKYILARVTVHRSKRRPEKCILILEFKDRKEKK